MQVRWKEMVLGKCTLDNLPPAVWPDAVIKSCPNFSKTCPNSNYISFYFKVPILQINPKSYKVLWLFCIAIWHQDLSKVAQSGQTESATEKFVNVVYSIFCTFNSSDFWFFNKRHSSWTINFLLSCQCTLT